MFLKNEVVFLFVKFLWAGLIGGTVSVVLKTIAKIFKKNVLIVNVLTFAFWLGMGIIYQFLCKKYNNFAFSGVGLAGMFAGIIIIKISIDFFFDYFLRFVYNEINNKRKSAKDGQLQTEKKI